MRSLFIVSACLLCMLGGSCRNALEDATPASSFPAGTTVPFDISPFGSWFRFPPGSIIHPKATPIPGGTIRSEQIIVDVPKPYDARSILDGQLRQAGFTRINGCAIPIGVPCDMQTIRDYRKGAIDLSLTFSEDRSGTRVIMVLLS